MRAFIALELPKEIKTEIKNIQQQLERAGVQARWIKPEIAHLTLAFLGSITPNKVEPIGRVLEKVAEQIKPTQLYLSKIGCFPNPAKARIVFVDLQGELGKLNALTTKARKGLKKEGVWFDEKPFAAHLTLGRIKKRQNLTKITKEIRIKKVQFIADEISLTKSQLTEAGPIYTKLACVSLV